MENKQFNYTYKAPTEEERREIESIRRQYLKDSNTQSTEDKLKRIRKLNDRVNGIAVAFSLVSGIIGILIFGLGFSMVLEWGMMVLGIIVAILGIPLIAFAYPLYNRLLKNGKEKYGDEIIRLSSEILNEGQAR